MARTVSRCAATPNIEFEFDNLKTVLDRVKGLLKDDEARIPDVDYDNEEDYEDQRDSDKN